MTAFPPEGVVSGATNVPDPGPSAPEGVQAVREALSGSPTWKQIEALAAILEPEAFDADQPADETWRTVTQNVAIGHAAKVITEGWRPVRADDATVERVAIALAKAEGVIMTREALRAPLGTRSLWAAKFDSLARAAVQALRDGNSQPTPSSAKAGSSHPCCPHCTARTGDCPRCGVRDADPELTLCVPCDVEVRAEIAEEAAALRDGNDQ